MLGFTVPPATFADPSPKLQLKVYGAVPPDALAVKLTDVPAVPVVGADVKETARARGEIVILLDAVCLAPFASVTLTLTVKVPLLL